MGGKVKRRNHTLDEVFLSGSGSSEVVVVGYVEYWDVRDTYTKKNLASIFSIRERL